MQEELNRTLGVGRSGHARLLRWAFSTASGGPGARHGSVGTAIAPPGPMAYMLMPSEVERR